MHRFGSAVLKRLTFVFVVVVMLVPFAAFAGVIDEAQPLTVGLTNILDFLLSIVGVVGIIGLVIAGILYFSAAGDMRQLALAKKATLGSITGIIIALGGYALIRTIGVLFAT